MGLRFLGAAFLLTLIVSDASAAELVILNCPPNPFGRFRQAPSDNGLKATMQIEVRQGEAEALRAAFGPYATSRGLRFRTSGYDAQTRGRPPTIVAETTLQGVVIKIEVPEGLNVADIAIHKICYADEEWQAHWNDLKDFVAANNYRILSVNDLVGGAAAAGSGDQLETIDVRPLLSLPPLAPINTQQ